MSPHTVALTLDSSFTLGPPLRTPHTLPDFQSRLQHALGDEFLIERELGGAGMSRVFVAVETALQRRVVVKVLPPELAAGVNVERFRREIQLAAQLQHPHIVPLLSTGDEDGLLWFTMPYIEGESLRGSLLRNKRLPPRDVVRIMHDVVDALAYAHARGVVHRDIKPENILTSGMHALVTDFGVAKALRAAVPAQAGTVTGMAIGTPAYMAPEQLAADPAADHRVDLYAVGLLAYELLTGVAPFSGSSPQATLAAQLTMMPEPPHRALTDVPESLSAIIMGCLAKDAARRPPSAAALLAELDALPPMGTGSSRSIFWRRHLSNKRVWAGAAALAVAMTLVFAQQTSKTAALDTRSGALAADSLTAMDAGPGGSRIPTMEIAPVSAAGGAARSRSPAVAPETVVVMLREGVNSDGTRSIAVPVVISRAESLAIAQAIRSRTDDGPVNERAVSSVTLGANGGILDSNRSGTGVGGVAGVRDMRVTIGGRGGAGLSFVAAREELLDEVRKVFSDSMSHALVRMDSALSQIPRGIRVDVPRPSAGFVSPLIAPNNDGRIRVVIGHFASTDSSPGMRRVARETSRNLRQQLPTNGVEIVDDSTTARASDQAPDRMALGWMLRADYLVSGTVRDRGDSLSLLTVFTDVRGGRFSRISETVASKRDPRQLFDGAIVNVSAWLDSARVRHTSRGAQRSPRDR